MLSKISRNCLHRFRELHIKFTDDVCKGETQLCPGETRWTLERYSIITLQREAHLMPKHILGPLEKATSQFSSPGSFSQRSGCHSYGSEKISGLKCTKVLPHETIV